MDAGALVPAILAIAILALFALAATGFGVDSRPTEHDPRPTLSEGRHS